MANKIVLLINVGDIKSLTSISGNVDTNKILPVIQKAQIQNMQYILGTRLLEKLQDLIASADIDLPTNSEYKTLLRKWVMPCHVNYSVAFLVTDLTYVISNSGVNQHVAENSNPVTKEESSWLKQNYLSDAEFQKNRLMDYLCANSTKFPEYYQNKNEDMSPGDGNMRLGWVI